MHKKALIACAAAALLVLAPRHAAAQAKAIDRPTFALSNTTTVEVSRVELTDTATILYMSASHRPKSWIKISPTATLTDGDGCTYTLLSAKGIEPGERLTMPESGEAEFSLAFSPVAPGTESVDFAENTGEEGEWKIWGICLRPGALPQPQLPAWAKAARPDTATPLPTPRLRHGTATIRGRLLGYRPGIEKSLGIACTAGNAFALPPGKRNLRVQADGSFSVEFPVVSTTPAAIFSLNRWRARFFAAPGDTTLVLIDLREATRRASRLHRDDAPLGPLAYVRGPLAHVAHDLNRPDCNVDYVDRGQPWCDFDTMTVAQVCDYYRQRAARHTAEWLRRQDLSLATRQLCAIDEQARLAYLMELLHRDISRVRSRSRRPAAKAASDSRLIADSLRRFMPTPALRQQMNDARSLLSTTYLDVVNMAGSDDVEALCGPIDGSAAGLAEAAADPQRLFLSLNMASTLYDAVSHEFTPLADTALAVARRLPEALRTLVMAANDSLLAAMERNSRLGGYTIHEAPATTDADSLLAAITAPWRGRAVLIDFWNTWCAPCRMGHEAMKAVKAELEADGTVFINIANHTSPEGAWRYMLPDIGGHHYRLGAAQWQALSRKLGMRSIPFYLFVAPDGTISHKQAGFAGAAPVRDRLRRLAGK